MQKISSVFYSDFGIVIMLIIRLFMFYWLHNYLTEKYIR